MSYRSIGKEAEAQAHFKRSLELFEQSVKRQENYADGWMNLGSAYGILGNHQKAADCFNKGLEYVIKIPTEITIRTMLSIAYTNLNRKREAEEELKKVELLKQQQN